MKPPPFEYHVASSTEEAVGLLGQYGEDAKVLAGGQSLLPLLALRLARPEQLIDINRIPELASIDDSDGLFLGAVVRQRVAERSPVVAEANPLIAAALRFVGHPAIRNRGTIGGSIAHADPAAELPTLLSLLDGSVEAVSERGSRTVAASEFFSGFLTTALEPDEVLTGVRFPPWVPGTGWSFLEFSRRSGDFAVAGVGAVLRLDAKGSIAEARVALSGIGPTPERATKVEAALVGQAPTSELWATASADAAAGVEPPSDIHGSAAYRRHLVAVLTERALREAHDRTEVGA